MAMVIFEDQAGNVVSRASDDDNPELRKLKLGDRIGDGQGGKVRLVSEKIAQTDSGVVQTWTVVPWTED